MLRNILFVLLAVISVTYIAAVPLEEINIEKKNLHRFRYIGSFKNLANGKSGSSDSLYFVSENGLVLTHEAASTDCVDIFGSSGRLLTLETQEEIGNITKFLQDENVAGSLFWTSGRYNTGTRVFEWTSGVRLSSTAPWGPSEPISELSSTRIALHTVGSPTLRTQSNTVATRYICELRLGQEEEQPEPCYNDNDLVIVVDCSGSIGQQNYYSALEFAAKLTTVWVDNPSNRIAVVVYSDRVQTVIGLGESATVDQIRTKVYNAPYFGSGTASDLGIKQAVAEFQRYSRNVPKNLVFLTDGASNSPSLTLAEAQKVQAAGIRSFSVGIGSYLNQQELLAIAGYNSNHVFNTNGFEDLLKLLLPVSRRVCP